MYKIQLISSNSLQLITGYAEDDNVKRLINTYDFYILPVMNPDGYEYQWNTVSPLALFQVIMLYVKHYYPWLLTDDMLTDVNRSIVVLN